MRRFGRFIILAVIGFGVGAAVAYFQGMQQQKVAVPQPAEQVVEAPVVEQQGPLLMPEAMPEVTGGLAVPEPQAAAAETAVAESAVAEVPEQVVPETVPGSSVGGAFSLTDHNGVAVTEKSWPGKYKLVFFGFTHCPDVCPTTLDKLTTALNALGEDAAKVQTLFVTTDPARDTAEAMKTYVGGYHSSILGLTGTEEQIKAAEDTYKVYAAKVAGADPSTYTMDHSSYVFLMSPDDQLLEILKSDDTAETVAKTVMGHLVTPETAPQP